MPIRPFLEREQASFGPDDITLLSTAFEDCLATLGLTDRNDPVTTLVAKAIIEAARQGERDHKRCPDRMRADGRSTRL